MDKARCNNTGMPINTDGIVSAEDGIVEFVVEICMHFGSFDDNTQVRLQGNNLNMGKEHFRIGCCQGRDAPWTTSLGVIMTRSQLGTH